MCYQVIHSLKCNFCDTDVSVFRACGDTDNTFTAPCGEGLQDMGGEFGAILTKDDNVTDVAFICGWCATFVHLGPDDWHHTSLNNAYVEKSINDPHTVPEFMLHSVHRFAHNMAEDNALCGYIRDGNTVVVAFCSADDDLINMVNTYSVPGL